ncbi:hypothetical protein Dsin_017419 [Dipteronia sinensis]|uniref:Uncharacterized protein n=1 Tax=Dipteronia sinensis TaxID=43782 RepID=A0AAE0AFX2_9ROSI|nr:hypothetical protein Dsin_017419 [Dipteronia sinensis]
MLLEIPDEIKCCHKGLKNADELYILFKDVATTGEGEGAWAPSTNFVPDDGEDRSYNEQIAEVDRMHGIEENLNNDFDRVDGLENIEINIGSPTYVNTTEDNGREKRKTFRSRNKVADIMLKHLDRIAKAVENKKSTKKDDTSITEAIELLCNNTTIPKKSELYMLATKRFLKKQNKEMFAALKDDPEVQIEWLKGIKN